ncbi:hypothetical protein OOT46_10190 [Aquabacterium sp. A7-Y]|uniref:DUF7931 domain-containing protein n=1 Tax=Aquabacterium sp. A7-Y TaxID=1349605 RepID=UPI00223E645D|nr:hypothetical protein [Aquabacterium sp. A7-Y]MCW7538216.1 hypothetical protein [Aquabacterium sp. A7-Y]
MTTDARNDHFDSRSGFREALLDAFAQAAQQGWSEIWLCDLDFADWPLGERTVVETLTQWAYAHRRLRVLACHYDDVVRRHARWVAWRRDWAHIVECRAIEHLSPETVPRAWLAPRHRGLRVLDPVRLRGVVEKTSADLIRLHENLDEVWQRSVSAFPSTTLGL